MQRFCQILIGSILLLGLYSCGTGSSGTPPPGAGGVTAGGGGGGGGAGVTTVSVIATPASVATGGASTVTATVTVGGVPAADGTVVTFNLSNALGSLSAPSNTTVGGSTSVTFTAGGSPGTTTVTAASGGANSITAISIGAPPPPAGGIQFISATPNAIGIAGGGQATTSTIIFRVTDSSNVPVPGAPVTFIMSGPSGGRLPAAGGEYIGLSDATPTTASGTTDATGSVSVLLNSGAVAGPVTITASATVGASSFNASSSVISIGGGVASATHFDLLVERKNLPGLALGNFHTTFTALLADRFGNYNVLAGTSVSFYTEAGAIDASGVVDATGQTTADFRTQAPNPVNVAMSTAANSPPIPVDEDALINTAVTGLNARYGLTLTGANSPRDGWVSVLATVRGEETFVDANGNGLFDGGETFTDLGEPFIDQNDNGTWDVGEFYIDDNGNGVYDGPNGAWDGPGCAAAGCQQSKLIWRLHTIMFTSHITHCHFQAGSNGFVIGNGGVRTFRFMVSDLNLNAPVPGTTITAALNGAGALIGQTSFVVPDQVSNGPVELAFTLADNSIESPDTPAPAFASLTVTVVAGGNEVVTCPQQTITGTVD